MNVKTEKGKTRKSQIKIPIPIKTYLLHLRADMKGEKNVAPLLLELIREGLALWEQSPTSFVRVRPKPKKGVVYATEPTKPVMAEIPSDLYDALCEMQDTHNAGVNAHRETLPAGKRAWHSIKVGRCDIIDAIVKLAYANRMKK
jgi:hypothetical protein